MVCGMYSLSILTLNKLFMPIAKIKLVIITVVFVKTLSNWLVMFYKYAVDVTIKVYL